jgi:uncharacterized protein (DUF305 family)
VKLAHPTLGPRRLLAVPAVALVLVLGACGGHDGGTAHGSGSGSPAASHQMATYPPVTPGPAAAGPKNDTDVAFANDMIPHHGQAVQMADMILARTTDADVKALAERIKQAQVPEIATLSGWLKGWGTTPPDPYAHMAGMEGMEHNGMMTTEQMAELDRATGAAADKAFLTLMQEHHQGAIDMAEAEVEGGVNAEAKKLAQGIITSQSAEIEQMKAMLTAVG